MTLPEERLKEEENPAYSLHEIQETFSVLWLTKQGKQYLQKPGNNKRLSDSLEIASASVLQDMDQAGAFLYGRLIQYGHLDVMTSIYPYCARLLRNNWNDLVLDYLEKFPPQHYNLNRIAKNFSEYLTTDGASYKQKYPYIAELADYEWLELEKMEEEAICLPAKSVPLDTPESFVAYAPLLNPTLTLRRYTYPIPQIVSYLDSVTIARRSFKPRETSVVIYRHPESHYGRLEEIDPASTKLLEALEKSPCCYADLLKILLMTAPGTDVNQMTLDFIELIEEFQQCGIFIGSQQLIES